MKKKSAEPKDIENKSLRKKKNSDNKPHKVQKKNLPGASVSDWHSKFMFLSAATGQAVYIYDIPTQSILWYGMYRELLGYSSKELTGSIEKWMKLVHPDDVDNVIKELKIAEKKSSSYNIQYRFKTRKKGYITVLDRGFFTSDEKGKMLQLIGQVSDVSYKTELNEIVRKKENEFLSVINEMPILFTVLI